MKRLIFVLIAVGACVAATAFAGEILIKVNTHNSALERWTAEDFATARPFPMPTVPSLVGATRELPPTRLGAETFGSTAEEPTLSGPARYALRRKLFDYQPAATEPQVEEPGARDVGLKNRGTADLNYTSSRLIPSSAAETFPYSAVGKLFFSDSAGDNYVCSGAVIARRLVVTAGHCVHGGPGEGWFDDFVFVPAYYYGDAPFGTWEYATAFVATQWSTSAQLPNAADWALLEMQDQGGNRISEVTGKLGFIAGNMAPNHLHILGYPTAFDDGGEMHQVITGDYQFFGNNTYVYGSDMTGGSSGGPWVQNFNSKSRGQEGGRNRARAAVVGVTSFTTVEPGPRIQGASMFDRNFKVLRQQACFNQPGNC